MFIVAMSEMLSETLSEEAFDMDLLTSRRN